MSSGRLFSLYSIGPVSFKNRLFFAAHGTGLHETRELLAYYQARIDAEVALIVSEGYYVVLPGYGSPIRNGDDDGIIGPLTAFTDACHAKNCRFIVQVCQSPTSAFSREPDGPLPTRISTVEKTQEAYPGSPAVISAEQVSELAEAFGRCAARVRKSGADGIELGTGNLFTFFLGEHSDLDADALVTLADPLIRTLREIRKHLGPDRLIGIRLSCNEDDPGGDLASNTLELSRVLYERDLIDYISLRAGSYASLRGASWIVPPMGTPAGYTRTAAKRLRELLGVPVFATGRVYDPAMARQMVDEDAVDMVGLVRALIADPMFVAKSQDRKEDTIRRCIACNQACIGHLERGHSISCIQFPESGRETKLPATRPHQVHRVLVIGGGPAGMKAASVAAQRGHEVRLIEKSEILGGQVRIAQRVQSRSEFGRLADNLIREMTAQGVDVRIGSPCSMEDVAAFAPHDIVLATGSRPRAHAIDGQLGGQVVAADEIVSGIGGIGRSVVIADTRSDWLSLSAAERLLENGHSVRLHVSSEVAGGQLDRATRYSWLGRLQSLGLRVEPYQRFLSYEDRVVRFASVLNGEVAVLPEIDCVVLSDPYQRYLPFEEELRAAGFSPRLIGDCLSPRTAEEAVLDGLKIGMAL